MFVKTFFCINSAKLNTKNDTRLHFHSSQQNMPTLDELLYLFCSIFNLSICWIFILSV